MPLVPTSEIRQVTGITPQQEALINAYLLGCVYTWSKNRPNEFFAARDLVGGENFDWDGTPIYDLYQKHIDLEKENEAAITAAAIDLGWMLKAVLQGDKRHYEAGRSGLTAAYRWVGNEP